LDGLVVVALEQAVAVPLATRKLADAGARVIKVERPGGDFARSYDRVVEGGSAYFVWLNRGKESVVLNLDDAEDLGVLERMIATADVFVQNLAPGSAARRGLGAGSLRSAQPDLITCDVSGYGTDGPYAGMKAYDSLIQGESGLQSVTGSADAPARVGISASDIAAGMHVHAAVLEALLWRDRTGEGRALSISLFQSMADWMSVPYLHQVYGGRAPERAGLRHPGIAPYGPYRSADGDTVLLAVQNQREWRRLCDEVLDRPDLYEDPRFGDNPARVSNREALVAALQGSLGRWSTRELIRRLDEGRIAFGRVRSVAEFVEHPQLRLLNVDTPQGRVRLPSEPAPWRAPDTVARVPALDEHGAALRREFAE
jgi:crotonobetainyl-CoA:carnitine CoA-transferase CaiB-like acyl-CoA transferase